MFDIGWSEIAIIVVVALLVLGPKELPNALRMATQWIRYARKMASEFQGGIDQMVREAELDEMKRHIDRATSFNVENEIRRTIDPTGDLQRSLDEPVMTDPLADPPKPVERTALEEKPAEALEPPVPESTRLPAEKVEAKQAVAPETEKHTP